MGGLAASFRKPHRTGRRCGRQDKVFFGLCVLKDVDLCAFRKLDAMLGKDCCRRLEQALLKARVGPSLCNDFAELLLIFQDVNPPSHHVCSDKDLRSVILLNPSTHIQYTTVLLERKTFLKVMEQDSMHREGE